MSEESENKGMSRRQFLGLAGGAVGAATLVSLGMKVQWSDNEVEFDLKEVTQEKKTVDMLVVGGGMAGLFAAVKGHDAGAKVMIVSKGRLGSSGQTPFAKGIFSYDASKEKLSLDQYVAKVSKSAIGTNNPVYTRQTAEHSKARVQDLKDWGFFDSPLYNKSFSKPMKERNIEILERVTITHLIKEKGKIAGAAGFSIDNPKVFIFRAKSVVLCTGAGGFKPNGFPICDLTHDGSVMAYDIGARVTGKEWNDGHPGRSNNPADCYSGWGGSGGMFDQIPNTVGVGVRHDLGVDINYKVYKSGNSVSGGPGQSSVGKVSGGPVRPAGFADKGPGGGHDGPPPGGGKSDGGPPGGGPGKGKEHKKGGGPPGMGGSSVGGSSAGMSIHKSEGLAPVDDKGASNIPGLYAAGDALGSHMCGGIYTQIGSSLAGSAVQGAIAAEAAAKYCKSAKLMPLPSAKITQIKKEMLAPLKRKAGYSPAWVTQVLQGIMVPNFVLYIKKESMLKAALAYVEELRDYHVPSLKAANLHELRLAHETKNMIVNAEMKLRASLMRKESRCSHYRLDYPAIDKVNWQAWINIFKAADGKMKLVKQRFDRWPL